MEYKPWKAIYTQSELDELIVDGIIEDDVNLRGAYKINLQGVDCINGNLSISDSLIDEISNLKEIKGHLKISQIKVPSLLTSLGSIEKVGGDVILTYSNISNLGNLKEVNGNLSLRNLNIKTLGNLSFVRGNLLLPRNLKDKVDLSKIVVGKDIKYFKDSDDKPRLVSSSELGYMNSDIIVPIWSGTKTYESENWKNENEEIKKFYKYFRQKFLNNEYLDVEGNYSYVWSLFDEFVLQFRTQKNLGKLREQLELIGRYYPVCEDDSSYKYIESFVELLKTKYFEDKNLDYFITESKNLFLEHNFRIEGVLIEILTKEYEEDKDIEKFKKKLVYINEFYPNLRKEKPYFGIVVHLLEGVKDYNYSWMYARELYYWDFTRMIFYQYKLKRNIFDGSLLSIMGYGLSTLGREFSVKLEPYVNIEIKEIELKYGKNLVDILIKDKAKKKFPKQYSEFCGWNFENHFKFYPKKHYKQFYSNEMDFEETLKKTNSNEYILPQKEWSLVLEVMKHLIIMINQNAESKFRKDNGLTQVGEEWVNETILYYLIKENYTEYIVEQHAKPKWIGKQHLDIFIPELNIGIEYQGSQHYEPVAFFGGEEGLENAKERDKRKQEICIRNGCKLILVDESYDFEDVKRKVDEIIEMKFV
ncbi:MAG TPA: hypothetical protein DCG75_18640 [Bacteroidales bacterium]|nr:hypothetical protein [Bacteroidales bacterium]